MASRLLLTAMSVLLFANAYAEIPAAYRNIATANAVPAEMLYAISLNESGKKLASKNVKPWPWTLNVAGKSYFYPTREEACLALQNFIKKYPLKNIDVGLAQVNIGWNGHKYFDDHCDGFEPLENLRVASILLANCYKVHKNWVNAAGCYHRPAGGKPAIRYKAGIRAKLASIQKKATNQLVVNEIAQSPASHPKNDTAATSDSADAVTNKNIAVQRTQMLKTQPKYIEPMPIRAVSEGVQSITEKTADSVIWLEPGEQQIVWLEPK